MGKSRLAKLRRQAAERQGWRCFYCGLPMVDGAVPGGLTRRSLSRLCTAEHLVARCEGGAESAENIVAACWWCNSQRHRRKAAPAPEAWREMVRGAVKVGEPRC